MKIYFDTEFNDLCINDNDCRLISAGFVAEDNREFYFELMDTYQINDCSRFVKETVLPLLGKDPNCRMLSAQAVDKLTLWIQSFYEPVELCCDSPRYDWTLIKYFFEGYPWPTNLERNPVNANNDRFRKSIDDYFKSQPDALLHHALWDARALQFGAMEYKHSQQRRTAAMLGDDYQSDNQFKF